MKILIKYNQFYNQFKNRETIHSINEITMMTMCLGGPEEFVDEGTAAARDFNKK